MTGDSRGEVLSLRLTAEEKRRIVEASERQGQTPSDFARDQLLRHVDDPAVTPGQNIHVNMYQPVAPDAVIQWLRRVLRADDRRAGL